MQDANASVHESALASLLLIQERGIMLSPGVSAHLIDLLITSLFRSKRPETVEDATRSARMLLRSCLSETLPVLLKGTTSRNLFSGLQSLVCIGRSMGVEIRGGEASSPVPACPESDLLSAMVDQLLRVVSTAKVMGRARAAICACCIL